MRLRWLAVGAVAVFGCESLRVNSPPITPPTGDALPTPPSLLGKGAGESGRDDPASAPPPSIPEKADGEGSVADVDSLTLAAGCLERGDRATAATHLEDYVRRYPDQIMFRAQLADLLVRVGRDDAARAHFERFADDAQATTGPARAHLVHTHTRLMEIAQRRPDRAAELFHRGVGLLLLVKEQDGAADRDPEFCEEMLCKAVVALTEAKEYTRTDPRPRVYLAEAYERTGNRRGADAERAAARGGFVPGGLTKSEWAQVGLRE